VLQAEGEVALALSMMGLVAMRGIVAVVEEVIDYY